MESKNVFLDTSAFYALMDRADKHHEEAAQLWTSLLECDAHLYTSNYIIIETLALLQNRLGFDAAHLWHRNILDLAEILWIDSSIHDLSFRIWLGMGRRKLSFVDCTSFEAMRHHKIENVFGFDKHFSEQGFEILSAEKDL